MDKTISVIIPVYNREASIRRCVESIQRQSYQYLEIIIVNDGSTDRSGEICDLLAEADSRIRVISQDNQGVSAARNSGIRIASGNYLQFVDSDDILDEFMCEKLVNRQQETNADLVICGYNLIENEKIRAVEATDSRFESLLDFTSEFDYYMMNFLLHSPWNKLYLRGLVQRQFDQNRSMGEDLLFNIDYLYNCNSIAGMHDVLYNYYRVISEHYEENGEQNATYIYCKMRDLALQRMNGELAVLLSIQKVYIDDILYHIRMACKENNYVAINNMRRCEEFLDAVSTSAKYLLKSRAVLCLNRFHLWIFLFWYFRIKNLLKQG